ncbi:MAG: hypothetical protein R2727_08130 [Bacteroidales bacterium]
MHRSKNDQFAPVISFTPEKYHLVIRSRLAPLFEIRVPTNLDGYYRWSKPSKMSTSGF